MRNPSICLSLLAVALGTHAEFSLGQVVQLPAVRTFSYSGSAWVPDGGTVSLGGTTSSAASSTSRGWGPYSGRSVGARASANTLTATARIIDLKALDDAILGANVPSDPTADTVLSANSPAADGGRRFLTSVIREHKGVAVRDHNEYRRALAGHVPRLQTAAIDSQVESDIRFYLEQGKIAERENRVIAARVYYRMAMESMTPEMIARYDQILEARKKALEELKEKNRPDRIRF